MFARLDPQVMNINMIIMNLSTCMYSTLIPAALHWSFSTLEITPKGCKRFAGGCVQCFNHVRNNKLWSWCMPLHTCIHAVEGAYMYVLLPRSALRTEPTDRKQALILRTCYTRLTRVGKIRCISNCMHIYVHADTCIWDQNHDYDAYIHYRYYETGTRRQYWSLSVCIHVLACRKTARVSTRLVMTMTMRKSQRDLLCS